jgi:hypothetical protein
MLIRSCLAIALALASAGAGATAVTALMGVSGDGTYKSVPLQTMLGEDGKTYYQIGVMNGDQIDPWVWQTDDFRVQLSGVLNPDPFILTTVGVTDFGGPSSFVFSWSESIGPTGPAVAVKSTLGASFTEGSGGPGATFTFTPANPNAAGKALTSLLGDGVTTVNPTPGVSIGPAFSTPAGLGDTFTYSDAAGYLPGPAGVWTTLGATLGFTLGGGGDAAALTVVTEVAPVPLPGAAWLLLSGLAGLAPLTRRRVA